MAYPSAFGGIEVAAWDSAYYRRGIAFHGRRVGRGFRGERETYAGGSGKEGFHFLGYLWCHRLIAGVFSKQLLQTGCLSRFVAQHGGIVVSRGAQACETVVEHHHRVCLASLYHLQAVAAELVVNHFVFGFPYCAVAKLASYGYNAQGHAVAADIVGHHACASVVYLVGNEFTYVCVEHTFLDDVVCHHDGRSHGGSHGYYNIAAHAGVTLRRGELFLLELHHPDAYVCGKADKDSIDEKEVERAEEIGRVACSYAEAGGAERGHEGRGYGNTRQYVAFTLCGQGDKSRRSAEEGNQHVVESRGGARQKF